MGRNFFTLFFLISMIITQVWANNEGTYPNSGTMRIMGVENYILSTSIGNLDSTNQKITDLPQNIRAAQVLASLSISDSASATIVDSIDVPISPVQKLTTNNKIKIIAKTGEANYYTMGFNSNTYDEIVLKDNEKYLESLSNTIITVQGKSELHFSGTTNVLNESLIILEGDDSWVYFHNLTPSEVDEKYIKNIVANNSVGYSDSTLRTTAYIYGTVVIPHSMEYKALEAFDGNFFSGTSKKLGIYTYHRDTSTLKDFNDKISSFKLKKGYMATFAENADGTGSSKVYVAESQDILIPLLPVGLNNKVSFVRVFPWRWTMKKGYAGGGGGDKLNCGWNYNWDNKSESTLDREYIPMRHNKNWNKFSNINEKLNTTHVLGFNEPDHTDQANMTVEEALDLWPKLLESGLRLGSPAPSDGGLNWLYKFLDQCDELNYRVDFVAMHWYLGGQTVKQFYNRLKSIHERTGRPIWITEWNNGANWTDKCCGTPTYEEQRDWIKQAIYMLDTTSFVERYAIYEWVGDTRRMMTKEGAITLAGEVYKDDKSTMAYHQDEGMLRSDNDSLVFQDGFTVSYAGLDVDKDIQVTDAGASITLNNKTWRRTIKDYSISKNTLLEFEFMSTQQGSFHGIGFDNDDTLSINKIFQLYGTDTMGILAYNTYDSLNKWISFQVPIGQYYTGAHLYMVFANDGVSAGNNSHFRNIKLYDPIAMELPKAPTGLEAEAVASNRVHLNWQDSSSNEMGFILERSENGSGFVEIATLPENSTFWIDNTTTGGANYQYRIVTFNLNGPTSPSNVVDVSTPVGQSHYNVALLKPVVVDSEKDNSLIGPNAVDGDNTSNSSRWVPTDTSFPHWIEIDLQAEYKISELKWYSGWDGYNNPVNDFQFQYWDGNAWVDIIIEVGNQDPSYDKTFKQITASKVRLYMTKAGTDKFVRLYEVEVYGMINTELAIPVAPTDLTSSTFSDTQINLKWTDNAINEEGFQIERKEANGTYLVVATVGRNMIAYNDTNLSPDTEYSYRISSYNDYGMSAYTNESLAKTLISIPATPSELVAGPVSTQQINLTWKDNDDKEEGFIIERKAESENGYTAIDSVGANVTAYSDSGLGAGTKYFYKVSAFNGTGNSGYSNIDSATTEKITGLNALATSSIEMYPNPVTSELNIKVSLQKPSSLEVSIFNYSGQKIITMAKKKADVGTSLFKWNGQGLNGAKLSSGIYLIQISTDKETIINKVIVE